MGIEHLKQHIADEAEQQAKDLVIDFDEAVKSKKKGDIIIKFNGKEFKAHGELMTDYFLEVNASKNKPDDFVIKALGMILGDEFVKEVRANPAPLRLLSSEILEPILYKYGFRNAGLEEDSGNE